MTPVSTRGQPSGTTKYQQKYQHESPAPRRRRRTPHPGVVLIPPDSSARIGWRARYTDATGKVRKVTLERIDAKTVETRRAWAVRLSEQLQRARSDAKAGVLRTFEDVLLTEAVTRYFEAHPRLTKQTRRGYQDAIGTLTSG